MTSPKIFHRLQTPPQASSSNQYKFSSMLAILIIDLYTSKAGSQMCKIYLYEEIQAFDTITKNYEANEELSRGFLWWTYMFEAILPTSFVDQWVRLTESRPGIPGYAWKLANLFVIFTFVLRINQK